MTDPTHGTNAGAPDEARPQLSKVEEQYEALKEAGKLNDRLTATYRCDDRKRCLLLHIFKTPEGLAFYQPRYRLSPDLNLASSNEAGRLHNTVDGDRRWKAQAGMLTEASNLQLNCDHVKLHVLRDEDQKIGPVGKPVVSIIPRVTRPN